MLWLYDSRDRMRGRRKLYKLPLTGYGKFKAWEIVLAAEFPSVNQLEERDDYQFLVNDDAEQEPDDTVLFNDYWAEFGWYLMPVEPDAGVPVDVEIVRHLESEK